MTDRTKSLTAYSIYSAPGSVKPIARVTWRPGTEGKPVAAETEYFDDIEAARRGLPIGYVVKKPSAKDRRNIPLLLETLVWQHSEEGDNAGSTTPASDQRSGSG